MSLRPYPPSNPVLFGYDPETALPPDHLARLVDKAVEEAVKVESTPGPGQPAYDPRLCLKVLIYGYALGIRSSRRLERCCREDLGFLFLTRGQNPSYRTLCSARISQKDSLEEIWLSLHLIAAQEGMTRVGSLVIDSCKIRADVSPDSVIGAADYALIIEELQKILAEAEAIDSASQELSLIHI